MTVWSSSKEDSGSRTETVVKGQGKPEKGLRGLTASVLLWENTKRWAWKHSTKPHVQRQAGDINTHALTVHWQPVSCPQQKATEGDTYSTRKIQGERIAETKLYYNSRTSRDLCLGPTYVIFKVLYPFSEQFQFLCPYHCKRYNTHKHCKSNQYIFPICLYCEPLMLTIPIINWYHFINDKA